MQAPRVFLVGAGPGDPGLLTVRGAALLASADVVIYDYLSNPALLKHCPQAECIYVGKKAAAHTLTQEQINALLVEKGGSGKRIVRLKGGDPFVFGRGGEECLALLEAGIPFEVVPGITAAIAAPAYAGIPVTHRDFNSSFTFITGHEKEESYQDPAAAARGGGEASDLDWASLAKLPAMAFYMGVKALPRICQKLLQHGMAADMPAACIRWGTTTRQQTVVGTLSDLPRRVEEAGLKAPALTIIGRVVGLRPQMNWFESRPLFGQRIAVTRTRQQASELSRLLSEAGAEVIETPTIEIAPVEDLSPIDEALRAAGGFDWIIFTSASGVAFTRQRLRELGLDCRVFGTARIAVIGDATARAVEEQLALKVDVCPRQFVAEALADALDATGAVAGKKFLMLRAEIARHVLNDRLAAGGAAEVRDIAVYQTRLPASLPEEFIAALRDGEIDWITFTSSSTAKNLIELLSPEQRGQLAGVRLASIGPVTTATLRELGLTPTLEAPIHDTANLAAAIIASGTR
jgi:uroporphyrinogen III methyltransferase/synthase